MLRRFLPLAIAFSCFATYSWADVSRVSVLVTQDGSIPQQVVRRIESAIVSQMARQDSWRPLLDEQPLQSRIFARLIPRQDMVRLGLESGADYVAQIRLSQTFLTVGHQWAKAQLWVVSPDSGSYVIVSEATWIPGDTLQMPTKLRLLLDRLVPPSYQSYCYTELHNQSVSRDNHDAVLKSVVDVHVRSNGSTPVSTAVVYGHWLVNGKPGEQERLQCDDTGVVRVKYVPPPDGRPVGDAVFVVDSVHCPGMTYDQQWPQRQVDQAVALLEDARADLDELSEYGGAVDKAERFLRLDETAVAMYEVLMNPVDAPGRRQQAMMILRRAQQEQRLAALIPLAQQEERKSWEFSAWYGGNLSSADEHYELTVVDCDDCLPKQATVRFSRFVQIGLGVRYRITAVLWLGSEFEVTTERAEVQVEASKNKRWSEYFVATPSARWNHVLRPGLRLHSLFGLRLAWLRERDDWHYWFGTTFKRTKPETSPYWVEPELSGLETGAMIAVGASFRVADWSPVWVDFDVAGYTQGSRAERAGKRVNIRAGLSGWY